MKILKVTDKIKFLLSQFEGIEPTPDDEVLPKLVPKYSNRKSQIMALGNAIVPQIAWVIGTAIMEVEYDDDNDDGEEDRVL